MPIDYATPAGQVRLLIPDTDAANQLFTDAQIETFLQIEGSVKLATALALETLASNEALVSKVIRTQDLQTDGAKVAAELRARAVALRQQVAEDGDGSGGFDVIDFDPYAGMGAAELAERGLIP